jgi:superfamily II DNA or RNA helicase
MSYMELLKRKSAIVERAGDIDIGQIHPSLFPFQRDCVEMLLKVKRGAAFLDTGLGKTIIQCE